MEAWARIALPIEKIIMTDDDWYLIDGLIQNIILSLKNTEQILQENTDDEEIRNLAQAMR